MDFINFQRINTGLPTVEANPIIWQNELCVGHVWQSHWDDKTNVPAERRDFRMIFTNADCDEIIGKCPWEMPFSTAFAWEDTCYVIGPMRDKPKQLPAHNSFLSCSKNLNDWSEPVQILAENNHGIYNHSLCYDGNRFVMLIESNSDVPFTIRFAESSDLRNWNYIPGAIFGKDQYVGGPTLKYSDGYYYLMYVEYLRPRWWFETWLVRSKNLVDWESSPVNPLISPEAKQLCHPDCPPHPSESSEWRMKIWGAKDDYDFASMEQCPAKGYECNVSDADFCEHDGKLRMYFTGGCQHWGGLLQYMDIKQTMSEFFASCYPG